MPETREPEFRTDDEINADVKRIVKELKQIHEDDSILKYNNPTKEELQEIISKASTYSGNFFHSEVTLEMNRTDFTISPPDETYKNLYETVEKLSEDKSNGIYLIYSMKQI